MAAKNLKAPATTKRVPAELVLRRSAPAQSCQLVDPRPILRVEGMSPYRPTRREFLIGAGILLVLAPYGCGGLASEQREALEECEVRPVEHPLGAACVPEDPQRVVVMDGEVTFDPVVALGIDPIGAPVPNYTGGIPDHLLEQVEGAVARVGTINEPSLERIADLEPDLIIGVSKVLENGYDRLSKIAPTVATGYEDPSDWKGTLREVAGILGREEEAGRELQGYDQRVESLREDLGSRADNTTVSVVRATVLGFRYLTLNGSLPGSVIKDVGLSTPPDQDAETEEPYVELSREEIPVIEADYVFITVDEGQQTALRDLRSNPLWNDLGGAQIEVPSPSWVFGNVLTANVILDDLEKHLLGG